MVISIHCSNYKFATPIFLGIVATKKILLTYLQFLPCLILKAKVIIITSTLSHVRKSDTNSLIRNSSFYELVTLVI